MADKKSNNSKKVTEKLKPNDLLSKEEEYRRINEELEARTAILVSEADALLKEKSNIYEPTSFLASAYSEDIANDLDDLDNSPREGTAEPKEIPAEQFRKPPAKASKIPSRSRCPVGSAGRPGVIAENVVPTADDREFLTDLRSRVAAVAEAHQAGDNIDDLETGQSEGGVARDDDVLPGPAADLGSEAQIRFLKAKLRVMQEENEKLITEFTKKHEETVHLAGRIKEVEDERNRLHRTNTAQQVQIDKYKKISDDSRTKADRTEAQLQAVKKDLDATKRSLDQQGTGQRSQEVRLNRALEEADKCRAELARVRQGVRETAEADKRRLDQLMTENKRLERQKGELIAGFKKQMRLIDVLKRQRMHIEAAKMLQFAEEDFVKALDWSN